MKMEGVGDNAEHNMFLYQYISTDLPWKLLSCRLRDDGLNGLWGISVIGPLLHVLALAHVTLWGKLSSLFGSLVSLSLLIILKSTCLNVFLSTIVIDSTGFCGIYGRWSLRYSGWRNPHHLLCSGWIRQWILCMGPTDIHWRVNHNHFLGKYYKP